MVSAVCLSNFYTVQSGGVLYYLGDRPPSEVERELIESWMKLPTVTLLYDGPNDMEDDLVEAALDVGILTGAGTPLFVFLRRDDVSGLVAVWISCDGTTLDNFTDLGDEEKALSFFKRALYSIFGKIEKPENGFIVTYDDGSLDVRIGKSDRPVVFRKGISEHVLRIGERSIEVPEGFTTVLGKRIYVGRDTTLGESSPVVFVEGVEMVYPDGSVFKDGTLIRGGEKIPLPEVPLWTSKGVIVLRNSVYRNGKKILDLRETVLDVVGGHLLLSDGSLMDIEGRWRKRIGCTPIEWFEKGGDLYVADVCGNFTVFDFKSLRQISSKRFPGLYGFDFLNGETVLGVRNEVIKGNERKKALDFCVVSGELETYGEEINIIRTHRGLALIVKSDELEILPLGFKARFKDIRIFKDFIAVSGVDGTWVVKFPRND